jgi:hypothetical protein
MQSFWNFTKLKLDIKLSEFIISSSNLYYAEPYISYTSDTLWLNLCHGHHYFMVLNNKKNGICSTKVEMRSETRFAIRDEDAFFGKTYWGACHYLSFYDKLDGVGKN